MKYFVHLLSLFILSFSVISYGENNLPKSEDIKYISLALSSPAFNNADSIPTQYTCDGQNVSPPLTITGVPKQAQSLMLIAVDRESSNQIDQDIIWFMYNIPPQTKTIESNQTALFNGRNSSGFYTYTPPCPKEGLHHYYFALYALNIALPETVSSLQETSTLIKGHLIGYANLMGTYARK